MSKTLAQDAGIGYGQSRKADVQQHSQVQWRTSTKSFVRSDGSIGKDKTKDSHSRPLAKQTIRNNNRRITKRARILLKRHMMMEAMEDV